MQHMYISLIRAPIDNRYSLKYSERITLVKYRFTTTISVANLLQLLYGKIHVLQDMILLTDF